MNTESPKKLRSERQHIRDMMLSYSNGGRYGDWMSVLVSDPDHPDRPAKVYKLMSEDSARDGYTDEAERLLTEAKKFWPEVVDWTGREKRY